LTFLPVARRFCVVAIRFAVFWRESRFCRTPADSVIFEAMVSTFLVVALSAGEAVRALREPIIRIGVAKVTERW
jgi:hypothetical protein